MGHPGKASSNITPKARSKASGQECPLHAYELRTGTGNPQRGFWKHLPQLIYYYK
jgi:hypothetical protein